jgi:hypothetical protein
MNIRLIRSHRHCPSVIYGGLFGLPRAVRRIDFVVTIHLGLHDPKIHSLQRCAWIVERNTAILEIRQRFVGVAKVDMLDARRGTVANAMQIGEQALRDALARIGQAADDAMQVGLHREIIERMPPPTLVMVPQKPRSTLFQLSVA